MDDPRRTPTIDLQDLHAAAAEHLIRYGGEFCERFIVHARGTRLVDEDGREILDFTSGQMCATLGHNHPAIVEALGKACREVLHLFSGMLSPAVAELAGALAGMLPSPLRKAILLSTGGEANEAALRMAKLATGRFEIVGLTGSWHGMTAGAASSTYSAGHRGYGPAMPGTLAIPAPNCYHCPVRHCRDRCDLTCLEVGIDLVDRQSVGALAAVLAEPVQSSGGVVVPPPEYFPRLRQICDERGMLLILDEAQTAFGRLGAAFGFERFGVVPDVLTLSKTLGGGLPLSAAVTSAEIEERCFRAGFLHYTSHVSDPWAAEVGLAVIRVLVAENLAGRAERLGARLKHGLLELQERHPAIGDVRGMGLLLGVEIVNDRERRVPDAELGRRVSRRCLELGLSMNIVTMPGLSAVWRIAPPLTVGEEEIDRALAILDQALSEAA